jgi:hypothetical protein
MPPSGIEKLPVELLQPIFFQSDCNIALLQASPLIGLRLSDDYVYHAICNHYLQEPMLDHRVRTPAQTYIFARKWMTWTFFKSWIMKTYAPIGCLCGSTTDEGCFDAQWPPNFEDATSLVFSRSHLPQFAFIKARLPKKLLCGPWTEDKVQFLRFLLWMTSMTVDWSDNDARETAAKGRQQAMRERNLEAVELFNHNRRLGKAADMSSIQFAVIEGGCSRSIVYDTMAMAKYWERSTSWECAELDNWCAERISKGDPKGLWLQTKLMEMRTKSRHAEDGEADFLYRQRTPVNRLVHEPGDYDGGPQDRLLRRQLKWNQVSEFLVYLVNGLPTAWRQRMWVQQVFLPIPNNFQFSS